MHMAAAITHESRSKSNMRFDRDAHLPALQAAVQHSSSLLVSLYICILVRPTYIFMTRAGGQASFLSLATHNADASGSGSA